MTAPGAPVDSPAAAESGAIASASSSTSRRRVTVVTPVYNEAECLAEYYRRITAMADSAPELEFEFLLVDDGSKDASFSILSDLARSDPRIRIVRFSRNFGSYVALHAGIMHSGGDGVVMISADLQDPPEVIPLLARQWRSGKDVVWAVRRSRKDALWRRAAAGLFYKFFRMVAMSDYPERGHDFCLIDRKVVDALRAMPERNTSLFALIRWMSFDSHAIEYDRAERFRGSTHWTLAKMFKFAADSVISFSAFPVRIALWLALLVGLGLFLYMAFVVYGKATGAFPTPPGWPSLMTVILLTSGLQLFVLAILGEYLWRALDQIRGRPQYVVAQKVGFERGRSSEN